MITIVYSDMCPFCDMAKSLLDSMGVEYNWIDYTGQSDKLVELAWLTGMRTIPQIFSWDISKENLIGWYDELKKIVDEWKLQELNK